ncbi:MAG: hypothetical protein KJ955_06610 [Nanoarchaeota archaeon]|nr:hypothetical protein [Nanoarchaeota archaeon]
MGIEILLKAYLVTYWPREQPDKAMIAYSTIDVKFEEECIDNPDGAGLHYEVKIIAMLKLAYSADFVAKHKKLVHDSTRKTLVEMGLITPSPERKNYYTRRINSLADMDAIKEQTAVRMIEDYFAKQERDGNSN